MINGIRCVYCGIESDGDLDHQPPVYVLHRFANGGLVTRKQIHEHFGRCKLVPCCTICNMGLGAYHGVDDNDRRREILRWFDQDPDLPLDKLILVVGMRLVNERITGKRGVEIYRFMGAGRIIYVEALSGLVSGKYADVQDFPEEFSRAQSELASWLRAEPGRKPRYFMDMAKLESYRLLSHVRSDPRGQFNKR